MKDLHSGQYALTVVFVRELGDDADVIGVKHPSDAQLIAQLRKELQEAFSVSGSVAGQFEICQSVRREKPCKQYRAVWNMDDPGHETIEPIEDSL